MLKNAVPKGTRDNRANQLNPTHPAYHQSRGSSPQEAERSAEQARMDRRAPSEVARTVRAQPDLSKWMIGTFPPTQSAHRVVSKGLSK